VGVPVTYRVLINGFDPLERAALEACFEPRRLIAYRPAQALPQADLVIVDADDPAAREQALQLLQPHRVLFVGAARPPTARWHLPRPVDPDAVLAHLDELVATEKPPPHAFTDPFLSLLKPGETGLSFRGFGDRARDALGRPVERPVETSRAEQPARRAPDRFPDVPAFAVAVEPPALSLPLPLPTSPTVSGALAADLPPPSKATMRAAVRRAQRESQTAAGPAISAALIVEDHAPTRLLLAELLGSFGFQPVSASTVAQAEQQLAERAFGVVFLGAIDDPAGEVAGIELCHRIKQQVIRLPALPPRVVMVWSRPRAADHVRARLAGCDHFVTGPVGRGPLAQALEAVGVPMPEDPRGRGLQRSGSGPDQPPSRSVSTTGA
jgi:CheY-like chemotaxis protein